MRRMAVVFVGILALGLMMFLASPAIGGDYHKGATLLCSDCHVMHYSQSHGYNANGSGLMISLGASGPYGYLLRNNINDLCLECHDGSTLAPDVLEGNTGGAVRQAGALNRDGTAPYYNTTGHTLDATDTAPGGTWAPDPVHGLTCVDCHQPHGYGGSLGTNAYRNMTPNPGGPFVDPPDYAVGTNDTTRDVFERAALSYDVADVDFNEPDPTASTYGQWCGGCHADFHGGVGSTQIGGSGSPPEHFDRHPTAGVDIGALGGGHSNASFFAWGARTATTKLNYVKVMTSTENWTPTDPVDVTDHTPGCMSCHKGHGNQNAFGLIYMDGLASGGITEEGTAGGTYKDLCKQCHSQG